MCGWSGCQRWRCRLHDLRLSPLCPHRVNKANELVDNIVARELQRNKTRVKINYQSVHTRMFVSKLYFLLILRVAFFFVSHMSHRIKRDYQIKSKVPRLISAQNMYPHFLILGCIDLPSLWSTRKCKHSAEVLLAWEPYPSLLYGSDFLSRCKHAGVNKSPTVTFILTLSQNQVMIFKNFIAFH